MLKGANLKGGRHPSDPYWPAATGADSYDGNSIVLIAFSQGCEVTNYKYSRYSN